MICKSCGKLIPTEAEECSSCGASVGMMEYAPPGAVDGYDETDDRMAPWEYKRWRIAGITWAALITACITPPAGLILSIMAISYANKFRHRPGNRAAAFASLGAVFHIGIIWVCMVVGIVQETQRYDSYDYYDDPTWTVEPPDQAQQELNVEFERVLDEMRAQQDLNQ